MTATEYVVLVDRKNQAVGQAEKLAAHAQNLLHRAFSIFIFRKQPKLELLLQQRALTKYHSPGLWTNTCCSHPRLNEDIVAAGERRLSEEFGMNATLTDLGWFHYNAHFDNGLSENEIDHVLLGFVAPDHAIRPDPNEIQDYKWISVVELEREIQTQPQHFTPWLAAALAIVKPQI